VEFNIAVLGGDGIGPEVTNEGVRALEAVGRAFGHSFNLSYGDIGGISIDKHGTPLTDETIGLLDSNDAVLFGAVGGPKWDSPDAKVRPEMGLLDMRAHMGVFANIRPVKVYPWLAESSVFKPDVINGVDMVVVRELTGGLYYAEPRGRRDTPNGIVAEDTMRYTEGEIERVIRVGFELARGRRKKTGLSGQSQRIGMFSLVADRSHQAGRRIPGRGTGTCFGGCLCYAIDSTPHQLRRDCC
jgi:3-isopropylmalate dehydrogenase